MATLTSTAMLLFLGCTASAAQTDHPKQSSPGVLALELVTWQRVYYSIDIIPLQVRLKNISAQPIILKALLKPGSGLTINLKGPKGEEGEAYQASLHESMLPISFQLDAGKELRTNLYISPGLRKGKKFSIPHHGRWNMIAVFDDERNRVFEKCEITLKSSQSLDDEIQKLFGTEMWHRCVLNDGCVVNADDIKPYMDFHASRAGAAPQHFLIAMVVGRNHQRGKQIIKMGEDKDRETGQVRAMRPYMARIPNYPAAKVALQEAADSASPTVRAEALFHLAECYFGMKNLEAASAIISRVPPEGCDDSLNEDINELSKAIQELRADVVDER